MSKTSTSTATSSTVKNSRQRGKVKKVWETNEKIVLVVAPNGNKHPVQSPDEGVRFMAILANGYLDVDTVKLTSDFENCDIEEYVFGGWKLSMVDKVTLSKLVAGKYKLTNGDKVENVSSIEAISHVCDCSIHSVSTRLKDTPEGFTINGWFVEKVGGV
jgi:hypothetical protein